MSDHAYFEELCASVAGGLASEEEFRALENHLEGCKECRDRFEDFALIGAGILSQKGRREASVPPGMTARFVARAVEEGIPLRKPVRILPTWAPRHSAAWAGAIAAAIALLFLALPSIQKFPDFLHRKPNAVTRNAPASAPMDKNEVIAAATVLANDSTEHLRQQLSAAIADKQQLAQALVDLNNQIKAQTQSSTEHDANLASEITTLQGQLDQLRQQSTAKDAQIAELSGQLQLRENQGRDQVASMAQSEIQLRSLREELAERDATIQNQRQLLAAGSQARDLIIARNLHIIDVHDNNGEGERQRAFGRIFYTEGKQIVFYAYDLNSAAKLKQQVAFHVWGGKLGDEKAVKNLGIFHNEDAAAGRWLLTFDDPHVLAQINTVFVTAESKKNAQRPDGRQILFAYLGDKANHP